MQVQYLTLKDGHSKNYIFGNDNENPALSIATHQSFGVSSTGFPYEICLHFEAQNSNIVATISNKYMYWAARLLFCDVIPSQIL